MITVAVGMIVVVEEVILIDDTGKRCDCGDKVVILVRVMEEGIHNNGDGRRRCW